MPLEPTEEQECRIADLLLSCGSTRGCEMADAGRVWDLVRDMVLEAAARAALTSVKGPPHGEWDSACAAITRRVLDMVGTP